MIGGVSVRHRRYIRSGLAAGAIYVAIASTATATKPDLELGSYLAGECLGCHRHFSGSGANAIPTLFGMAEETFGLVMRAYRERKLDNPVMQNVASRLKDDEIEALAAFFARTKPR